MSPRYRKRPVEIEAIRFTGDNWDELRAFTSEGFRRSRWDHAGAPEGVIAEVWDKLHHSWIGVKASQWILRGVVGEYYPCADETFTATYDAVEDPQP